MPALLEGLASGRLLYLAQGPEPLGDVLDGGPIEATNYWIVGKGRGDTLAAASALLQRFPFATACVALPTPESDSWKAATKEVATAAVFGSGRLAVLFVGLKAVEAHSLGELCGWVLSPDAGDESDSMVVRPTLDNVDAAISTVSQQTFKAFSSTVDGCFRELALSRMQGDAVNTSRGRSGASIALATAVMKHNDVATSRELSLVYQEERVAIEVELAHF